MSDNDNINSVNENQSAPVEDTQTSIMEYENFLIKRKEFSKEKEGFTYHVIEYKNLDAIKTKFSDEEITGIVNSYLAANMRVAATNALPTEDTKEETLAAWKKLIDEGKTCLLTEDEAIEFKPGREREPSTVSGFMKLAKVAQKNGDKAAYVMYLKKAKELMDAQLADIDSL